MGQETVGAQYLELAEDIQSMSLKERIMLIPNGHGQRARYGVVAFVIVAANASLGQESRIRETPRGRPAAIARKQATEAAYEMITGGQGAGHASTVSLVDSVDDNTPFLTKRFRAGNIWRIVIQNYRISLPAVRPEARDRYTRTVDVCLDANTGGVLKIVTRWPDGVPEIPPEPPAAVVESQMRRAGNERYHAFVDGPPKISFFDALEAIARAGGDPLAAKQIKGQYVLWSKLGSEPKPVWSITLRGIPAFPAAFPGVSENARNHLRYIVDGLTGKWLSATSVPQPETDGAKKPE